MPASGSPRSASSFPASRRLRKSREFKQVQEGGRKHFSKHFLLLVSAANGAKSRVGITITTKIDKRAVVRNKLKRRIRYIFRVHQERLKSPVDMVVIARRDAVLRTYEEVERELLGLMRRAGVIA